MRMNAVMARTLGGAAAATEASPTANSTALRIAAVISRQREHENIAGVAGMQFRRERIQAGADQRIAGADRHILLAVGRVGDRIAGHRRTEVDLPQHLAVVLIE